MTTAMATSPSSSSRSSSSNPRALAMTAGILGILGLIPGMPNFIFITSAAGIGWLSWKLSKQAEKRRPAPVQVAPTAPTEAQEASWSDVAPLDVLGLEVGYRLIPLVDKAQDGELLRRIRGIRKKFAQEVGYLVAPVHIRDNLELKPNAYRILLKGVEVGQGEAFPGQLLAINPDVSLARYRGPQPRIRLSGCPPSGSRPACAIRRRPMVIPLSMPVPSSPRT